MNFKAFRNSLTSDAPPAGMGPALTGLWWDAKGDWTKAHDGVQDDESPEASWVHAYLHRKEGDGSNAEYWYRRAGKAPAQGPLESEWTNITRSLLGVE